MNAYHPTLWRTCRVLANAGRLRCLKVVFEWPGSTVGAVAHRAGVAGAVASEYLRALQARGLILASRESRWVRYTPDPDPLVEGSACLLAALKRSLLVEARSETDVIHAVTAFTHPRRLEILERLQREGDASLESLGSHTRISTPALFRHLRKLEARRLVSCDNNRWHLAGRGQHLEKTLLSFLGGTRKSHSHTSRSVRMGEKTNA